MVITDLCGKQGGDIVYTPSFIIGLENKSTKEIFPHPISYFLFKNYHRNSGSVNTELTITQVMVPFLNFILDKVNREVTEYTEVTSLEDLRECHANAYLQYCVDEKKLERYTKSISPLKNR